MRQQTVILAFIGLDHRLAAPTVGDLERKRGRHHSVVAESADMLWILTIAEVKSRRRNSGVAQDERLDKRHDAHAN